jgi:NTE family protein
MPPDQRTGGTGPALVSERSRRGVQGGGSIAQCTGLVLTGGGARGAYQVGALRALARITGARRIPFQVVSGMSAGAVNAAAVAAGADDFQGATGKLARLWNGLSPDQVYRTEARSLARIGARWMRDLTSSGIFGPNTINYLLDTSPLRRLLVENLPLERVASHLASGALRGVSISATDYLTGTGISFFDGDPDIEPWTRSVRMGVRSTITVDHVLASSAIPLFFPPVRIGDAYFGDGCIRALAPLSPAIHMGADRIVAISVRYRRPPEQTADRERTAHEDALPLSEIIGSLMNSLFLDSLEADIERLERINDTLDLIPPETRARQALRIVPLLVLRPSRDLAELARGTHDRLPVMMRYLLRGIGANRAGEDLLSYLAFERAYLRKVMRLGHRDTMARRREVEAFLRPVTPRVVAPA